MRTIQHKDYSTKDRLFFVGDIHGHYKLFKDALEVLQIGKSDQVVAVGDLIDRGEQSLQTLTHFLYADNCDSVLGNHDHFMVKTLAGKRMHMSDASLWYYNGGAWSLSENTEMLKGLAKAVDEAFPVLMLIEYKGTKVAVSHAEIPTNCIKEAKRRLAPITANVATADDLQLLCDQQKFKEEFLWGRSKIYAEEDNVVAGVDLTVHGHTVTFDKPGDPALPIQKGNQIFLDTGSVFNGGRLTFAELIDGELQYHQFWFDIDGELQVL